MSRGPWSAATCKKHGIKPKGAYERAIYNDGRTQRRRWNRRAVELREVAEARHNGIVLDHWTDSRVEARAKAKAETEALRRDILLKRDAENRSDARARKVKTYIGIPCAAHDCAERYVISGRCTACEDRDRHNN